MAPNVEASGRVGFTCRYTPLAMVRGAGLEPYRILPVGEAPDRAGSLLHDNLCPHVKRVLDRALAADLPELAGVVFMTSCDAMRRLADAWQVARPDHRVVVLDLPVSDDSRAVAYFATELERLRGELERWTGRPLGDPEIRAGARQVGALAARLDGLSARAASGALAGGWRTVQEARNLAMTAPLAATHELLERLETDGPGRATRRGIPLLLAGNVLPDPAAFDLLEQCGAQVVEDDLCTGSRQLAAVDLDDAPEGRVLSTLAAGLLAGPPCGRTLCGPEPGLLARQTVARAKACGAAGVLLHVMKLCDPYLGRLPALRDALREAGLPLLVLEGDCTLRSLGQQRTRVAAFVEMLEAGR